MSSQWGDAVLLAAQVARFGVVVSVVGPNDVRNVFVNDVAVAIVGRPREEMLRASAYELLEPGERARMMEYSRRHLAGEPVPDLIECVIVRPDGTRIPVEFTTTRIPVDGQLLAVSFIQDVTARKASEHELEVSLQRFRTVVENAPDCIAITTLPEGRLAYVNPYTVRLMGEARFEDIAGRTIEDFLEPADIALFRERYAQVAAGKVHPTPYPYRLRTRSGNVVVVEFTSLPTEWEGRPAVLALGRDVTERTKMQAQLVRTDRLAALGTLAAGVAHEINNPLAFLTLGVDAVEKLVDDVVPGTVDRQRFRDVLVQIHEGTARIAAIVRDLKTFGSDEEEHAKVDVTLAVGRAVRVTNHEIRPRANLVVDVPRLPLVIGSRGRLEQVFVNLLVNAAQALDERRPQNEIRVTGRVDAGAVVVEVADNGPGIPPEVLGRIFDPFFTTKQGQGTGLGLSICHGIVAKLGGEISVESAPGEGTRFRVRLAIAEGQAETPTNGRPSTPQLLRHARILVVDDEPALGLTLRALLEPDHSVVSVTSGEEALALIASEQFDAILCDLTMPGLSGADVYERIRDVYPESLGKLVFMTGGAFTPRLAQFLERVECPRIDKPFTLEALHAVLARVL